MTEQERVRSAIAEIAKVAPSKVLPGSRLTEDLGIRSLQRVELAVLLEERLKRAVSDQLVMVAKTVGELETRLATG